ncbi:MAG: chorismate-binding protein [Candidatus Omnitrophota bacterium]
MRYGFEEARKILLRQFDDEMNRHSPVPAGSVLVRFKVPVMDMDIVSWLEGQDNARKVFWQSSGGVFMMAGIGAALEVSSDGWYALDDIYARISPMMEACPEAKFFTGMSFNRSVNALEWKNFPAIRVILPAVEVLREAEGFFLAMNVVRGKHEASPELRSRSELEKIRIVDHVGLKTLVVNSREDVPDYEDWGICAEEAKMALELGVLQSLVLARRSTLAFENTFLPECLMEVLLAKHKDDFVFLFSAGEDVFFGISPELLYARHGVHVNSLAVLDGCPRGTDPAHDDKLSGGLLRSDKILHGHNIFAGAMIEVFRQFCRSYQVNRQPEILKTENYQHLVMRLSGLLGEGVTDKEFLQALHPSLAVSGVPAEKARVFLQQHEVFDRGWFCGPVGFLSKDHTELVVAVRACLVEEKMLHVYAVAPFVRGTDPVEAWEHATAGMKEVFDGINGGRA